MGPKELVAVSARSSTEIVESDVGFFGKIPARYAAIVDSSALGRAKIGRREASRSPLAQCRGSGMSDERRKYREFRSCDALFARLEGQ